MAAPRHPLRSYIIALFRHGDLVSVREAVLICDASRQAISKWIKAEGIDIEARRLAHIAKRRTNAERYLDGKMPLRPPSKRALRWKAIRAKREWDRRRAEQEGVEKANGRDPDPGSH